MVSPDLRIHRFFDPAYIPLVKCTPNAVVALRFLLAEVRLDASAGLEVPLHYRIEDVLGSMRSMPGDDSIGLADRATSLFVGHVEPPSEGLISAGLAAASKTVDPLLLLDPCTQVRLWVQARSPCPARRARIRFGGMMNAIAVSDLHGNSRLYELLLRMADAWKISSLFIAGDLATGVQEASDASELGIQTASETQRAFLADLFVPLFEVFLADHRHTHVYAIMGNDDRRVNEPLLSEFDEATSNFHLINDRIVEFREAKRIRSFFPGEVPRLRVAGYPVRAAGRRPIDGLGEAGEPRRHRAAGA